MIYIKAYNYKQFHWWCDEHRIDPKDDRKILYISLPEVLRGRRITDRDVVIRLTDHWRHQDSDVVECVIREISEPSYSDIKYIPQNSIKPKRQRKSK